MKKKYYLFIILFALAAIAASYFLLPRSEEIALMRVKDKYFEQARADYEAQLKSGKITIELANQLSDLYLQIGAVDKAIEVMEKFISLHPDNLDARARLGTYYQYAQRSDDYVRNLEEINKLKPNPENLKTLSDIYNFTSEYDRQVKTLEELIKTTPDNNAKNYVDLANLLASKQSYAQAIDTLLALKVAHPTQFVFGHYELLISLLLDEKRGSLALQYTNEFKATPDATPAQIARLVNMLHFKGSVSLAAQAMESVTAAQISNSSELMLEHTLILLDQGHEDQAYAELKTLHDKNTLTPELQQRLLFLASARGEKQLSETLLKSIDLQALSEAQLIALIELAQTQNDAALFNSVIKVAGDAPHQKLPLLAAIVSVATKNPNAKQALAAIAKHDLTNTQLLQVASACARAGNAACAATFINRLPATDSLTSGEVATIGEIYLTIKAIDKGYAFMQQAMRTHSGLLMEQSWMKFAAARGDDTLVYQWLDTNESSVSVRFLSDLYFLALNNKHLELASDLAARAYAKEKTPTTTSLYAHALVKSGQFEKAVTLLRDNKTRTVDDENNYLFALSKLAAHQPAYRKELADYAAARLRSNISDKQKLTLIYALLDAKQIEPALPYIRELAVSKGGKWAALYAATLEKQGRFAEARAFWVQVAALPSTPDNEKRQIAYALLDHGYKQDAEAIFLTLANNANAKSEDVNALLYVWGSRINNEQIAWLYARMQSADAADKEAWAQIIADSADHDTIIAFVAAHQESLASPALAKAYFEALAARGELSTGYVAQTDNRTLLKAYAQAANNSGNKAQARLAYERLFALAPDDNDALREAGILAFEQADYSAARLYLAEYIETYSASTTRTKNSYNAFYHYGEILRREKRTTDAAPYYQEVLDLIGTDTQAPEEISKIAQSLVWTGKPEAGLEHYKIGMALYPANETLRADYVSTLLELKRYDEARALLAATPLANKALTPLVSVELSAPKSAISRYALMNEGSELWLLRAKPDAAKPLFSQEQIAAAENVSYASNSYDSVLLTAASGSVFTVAENAGNLVIKTAPDSRRAALDDKSQTTLRYALLAARIDLETGHIYDATKRLAEIREQFKNDPQYLGFAANAENYGGNWQEASILLARANKLAPHNEDITQLANAIRRINAPGIKVDEEWIKRGNDHEFISTLSGFVNATDEVQLGANIAYNHVEAKNIRRASGAIGDVDANKTQAEIYALYHAPVGVRVKGSLFANNDTAGAGMYYSFLNPLGETTLEGEYHRPNWDFTEGVLDDATRDRLGLTHIIKPSDRLTFSLSPAYHRYNVASKDDAASSTSVDFNATYRLRDAQPSLTLGYGLDAEYLIDRKKNTDATGDFTRLYPLVSRELHFVSIDSGYEFTNDTYGSLLLGYGYDRLGGQGASVEGRLTHEFNTYWDAQIRASFGMDNNRSNSNVSRVGAYLRYKF